MSNQFSLNFIFKINYQENERNFNENLFLNFNIFPVILIAFYFIFSFLLS